MRKSLKHLMLVLFTAIFIINSTAWANSSTINSWNTSSKNGVFQLNLQPESKNYSIGNYDSWKIKITDNHNRPITNAEIKMDGGMVEHSHGLPSQPQITQYLGNGEYLIEGVLFNMAGTWTFLFKIDTEQASDVARFDMEIVP
ncbi:MAG: FixH family protein [Pseudomonadota bacterium]